MGVFADVRASRRSLSYIRLPLMHQAVEERVEEVKLPLEDELAMAYAGRQEEKALRESDRRCVPLLLFYY